jgi:hypothetical protein
LTGLMRGADTDSGYEAMTASRPGNWVASLQRFARERHAVAEYCELCSVPLPPDHLHLVEPAKRRLLCVCRSCDVLLGDSADNKYRRVPGRAQKLENIRLTDAEWDALGIPIGLAFFYQGTAGERVLAFYPGPAGPTESLLELNAWSRLVANNPVLAEQKPDVEALLVNRINGAREYYRIPIDRCYALVGLIRTHWRGVSGGDEAWKAITNFMNDLREHRDETRAYHHG